MLRVLHLNYEFPPIGGGGANAHKNLLNEFANHPDLDITLLTTTHQSEPYSERLGINIQAHFIPIPKENLSYWKRSEVMRYLLTHFGFLHRYLKDVPFDLCHAFFGFPTGVLPYWFQKKAPYIVSVRGSDVPGYNKRFSLDYIGLKPLLKRVYRDARCVVANSHGLKHLYESQFPGLSARVIPNGIDTTLFSPAPNKQPSAFRIVTVSRLIPRKGIDLLLSACRKIHENGFPFHCLIVGEGPEEGRLKAMAKELGIENHVQFYGRKEKLQIATLLPQCDLFVLPSYAEGMSNAALEAMACGLPLLLTETGGSQELINGNGLVVPPGDAEALGEKLLFLSANPERLKEMGGQSRNLAEAMSWKSVADAYYQVYMEAAGRS